MSVFLAHFVEKWESVMKVKPAQIVPRPCRYRKVCWSVCVLFCWAVTALAAAQSGSLEVLREDVRDERDESKLSSFSSGGSPADCGSADRRHYDDYGPNRYGSGELPELGLGLFAYIATSPYWIPVAITQDTSDFAAYFPRFPYDHTPGCMIQEDSAEMLLAKQRGREPRRWSGRIRFDYGNDFGDLQQIGYHLLMTSSLRFGIETESTRLEERLPDARRDRLWLGDCNFTYRFAQGEHMQWRAGLGFNWLDDDIRTDFGFNFTYGVDYFPRKPWIFSSTLDWGTLGNAELFRIRATGGIIIHGVEAFAGYEYFDLDRTQTGSLIAGLRLWF